MKSTPMAVDTVQLENDHVGRSQLKLSSRKAQSTFDAKIMLTRNVGFSVGVVGESKEKT